jgi:hypothetical protein
MRVTSVLLLRPVGQQRGPEHVSCLVEVRGASHGKAPPYFESGALLWRAILSGHQQPDNHDDGCDECLDQRSSWWALCP